MSAAAAPAAAAAAPAAAAPPPPPAGGGGVEQETEESALVWFEGVAESKLIVTDAVQAVLGQMYDDKFGARSLEDISRQEKIDFGRAVYAYLNNVKVKGGRRKRTKKRKKRRKRRRKRRTKRGGRRKQRRKTAHTKTPPHKKKEMNKI